MLWLVSLENELSLYESVSSKPSLFSSDIDDSTLTFDNETFFSDASGTGGCKSKSRGVYNN